MVAFDVVSSGSRSGTSPIAWSHTCTGSQLVLVVDVAFDNVAVGGTRTVSYIQGGSTVNLVSQGTRLSGGSGKTAGFIERFLMINPDTGAHNITVSWSGIAPDVVQPAAISATGADQVTGLGTLVAADSAGVSVTSGTISVTGTSSTGLVVVGVADGSDTFSFTAGTSRFTNNGVGTGAAGNLAMATNPSNGGTVTTTWTQASDWYGALASEILPSGGAASPTPSPERAKPGVAWYLNRKFNHGRHAKRSILKNPPPPPPVYLVGHNPGAGVVSTLAIPVINASAVGDALLVCVGVGNNVTTVSSIADTQGNTYVIDNAATDVRSVSFGYAVGARALSTSDTITVTLTAAENSRASVMGIPGVSSVDLTPAGNGANPGSSPSASTGTLSSAPEVCVGIICNSGSTQPSSLNWPLFEYQGTGPVLTTAYIAPVTTASQTFSATITGGAAYDVAVITFILGGAPSVQANAGLATATASALGPNVEIDVNAGVAAGTGSALSPTASVGANAALATGGGTALGPSDAIASNAGLATGGGVALTGAAAISGTSGVATGTGSALSPSPQMNPNAGVATGTGSALAPTPAIGANSGLVTGAGAALQPTVSFATTASAGLATATGTALGPSVAIQVNAGLATATASALSGAAAISGQSGLATGTGSAQSPSPQLNPNAGVATGAGAALAPSGSVGANSGLATGAGAALTTSIAIQVNANLANAIAAALQPAVSTSGSTNANAGLATATGAALGPSVAAGANSGIASATGAALTGAAAIAGTSGVATGTGSAQSPSPQLGANSGVATGTGAALGPRNSIGANTILATGTGAALGPAAAIGVPAGVAPATGAAFPPGHGAGVGLASATAAPVQPNFAVTFTAANALAAAAALQPVVQATTAVVKGHVVTGVTGKTQSGTVTGKSQSGTVTGKNGVSGVTDTTEASTKVTGKAQAGSVS